MVGEPNLTSSFSVFLALGGLGGGAWAGLAAHACWAIRTWAGDEVAATLLYRRRWPLAYFCEPFPFTSLSIAHSRDPDQLTSRASQ